MKRSHCVCLFLIIMWPFQCCADEKWGDWKPHLAMILSNPSQRPDLDHKAVITLGDTLGK